MPLPTAFTSNAGRQQSPVIPQVHHFHSQHEINRLKLAAVLQCLKSLLAPVVAGILIYALLENDRQLARVAIALLGLTIGVAIAQWLVAARTRCPLCMTPVLAAKHCAKHRDARALLGSYRLRVAVSIFAKNSFHCPYCSEPSSLELRSEHPRKTPRTSQISRHSRG
ncbi:hypothetical protein HQ447_02995 [bacterium]|nr:hypothetical protein [bacterium]